MTESAPRYQAGRVSLAEYRALPEEDGYRTELVRGLVVREPVPGALHARVQVKLCRFLDEYAERSGAGTVLDVMGFVLEEDPPTVRGPDLALVRPELVIEVHRPGVGPRLLGVSDMLDGGDVLPSFSLPVARIFAL